MLETAVGVGVEGTVMGKAAQGRTPKPGGAGVSPTFCSPMRTGTRRRDVGAPRQEASSWRRWNSSSAQAAAIQTGWVSPAAWVEGQWLFQRGC
jgi:hypothetical protein